MCAGHLNSRQRVLGNIVGLVLFATSLLNRRLAKMGVLGPFLAVVVCVVAVNGIKYPWLAREFLAD